MLQMRYNRRSIRKATLENEGKLMGGSLRKAKCVSENDFLSEMVERAGTGDGYR